MNRREFIRRTGGAVAATALVGPVAGAADLRRRLVRDEVIVPIASGWLALHPTAGRIVAHAGDGRERWRAEVGIPRDGAEWAGRVYVSDAAGWVHVFDPDGGRRARLEGFAQPWGLLARPDGLHVADRLRHTIEVVGWAGGRRRYGEGLNGPAGLAAEGDLTWVADGGNERVVRLDPSGRVTRELRSEGLWRPRDVAVADGRVFAASAIPPELLTFEADGRLVDRWRPRRPPQSVAVTDRVIVGVS